MRAAVAGRHLVRALARAAARTASSAAGPTWLRPAAAQRTAKPAVPSHHRPGGTFDNPWPSAHDHRFSDIVSLMRDLKFEPIQEGEEVAWQPIDKALLNQPATDMQVTWLGHVTFLVQIGGINILTDPVFSHWASPFYRVGPERVAAIVARPSDLPPIDAVFVSHSHYDHLDLGSLGELNNASRHHLAEGAVVRGVRGGEEVSRPFTGTSYFSPVRALDVAVDTGVLPADRVHTFLDWWDTVDVTLGSEGQRIVPGPGVQAPEALPSGDLCDPTAIVDASAVPAAWTAGRAAPGPGEAAFRLACVPAQHNSQRFLTDRNSTLWSGMAIESAGRRFFFSGDTGYSAVARGSEETEEERDDPTRELGRPVCPAFRQAGAAMGPFDAAALPVGAYAPRWFMSAVHADPCDAVRMHKELGSRRSVGMHWGTYRLTGEPILEAVQRLGAATARAGIPGEFTTEPIGATLRLGEGVASE